MDCNGGKMTDETESINLDTYDMPIREKAKELGWTDVKWTYDDVYGGIYLGGLNPLTKKWEKVPEMNIKITIEGCCSMRKSEIAKIIGERLKEKGFGTVSIVGTDYKGEHSKGLLSDESVTIEVVPEKFEIRDGFEGNVEYALKSRERNKIELNTII